MTLPSAIYARISSDPTGRALGVERQREDCAALIERNGWTLAATFTDNDVSAYSGKARPGYVALVAAVRAGTVAAIVAWHPDRLHRSPRELEDFIDLVEEHSVLVHTVTAGTDDFTTASGRANARSRGVWARYESEQKSERVLRALQQRAEQGQSHGRRAYGWTLDGQVADEEAAVVREAAARIVRGDSLRSIVADFNDRGIAAPSGKPWGKTSLRHAVTRERNVGLLVFRSEVIGEGTWPHLLDRDLWEQARAVLTDPARRTSTGTAAAHLLSGIARCGVCGGPMRSALNRQVRVYKCHERSCVARKREDVDAFVTAIVLGRLARPDAVSMLTPERREAVAAAIAEADGLRALLDNAADDYADGKIDRRMLERITARTRPRLEAAQGRARRVDDSPVLSDLLGAEDVRAAWESFVLTRRRAVVNALVEVRVLRTTPGIRVFDPASVEVTWRREQAGATP